MVLVAAWGLLVIFPTGTVAAYECVPWGLRFGRCITPSEAWPYETGLGMGILLGLAGAVAWRWRDVMGP